MADVTVKYTKIQDTSVFDPTGKSTKVRRYTVFIGDHGPFTIDVPITVPFNEQAVQTQVQALVNHLRVIQT